MTKLDSQLSTSRRLIRRTIPSFLAKLILSQTGEKRVRSKGRNEGIGLLNHTEFAWHAYTHISKNSKASLLTRVPSSGEVYKACD